LHFLGETYDGYTVIVDVCLVVEGFFNLRVFLVRPEGQLSVIVSSIQTSWPRDVEGTHATPEGWRLVLLTVLVTMLFVRIGFKEVEWKLDRCCLE
jgi:hypothetical protein